VSLLGWAATPVRSYADRATHETDADGRATWALPPGEYRFRLDSSDPYERLVPAKEWRTANVWTPTGPALSEVRL